MIKQTKNGVLLEVKVQPGSDKFEIIISSDGSVKIRCKSEPKGGKANHELIDNLSRILGKDVRIIRGFASRKKLILIKDARVDDVMKLLKET